MQLLVSVRSASEARAALRGGAQIVDAKEPRAGALGPVAAHTLAEIRQAVPQAVPLSAALGDVAADGDVEACLAAVEVPLRFVKLGFLGVRESARVERWLSLAVKLAARLPESPRVMAVGYADWQRANSLDPALFPRIIRRAGAHGLLIDTALKDNGGLFDSLSTAELITIGGLLRRQESLYALAGSLGAEDVGPALDTGADILGVRGAVTDGGRNGEVEAGKVARIARLVLSSGPTCHPSSC